MKASDLALCARYEIRRRLARVVKRALGRKTVSALSSRVSARRMKWLILREGFASADGQLSWFYTAIDRGDSDPLTNWALGYIVETCPPQGKILVTGCGTGLTAFHLADAGFTDVTGIDLLPETIEVAEKIERLGKYDGTRFVVDDALRPSLSETYDVVTALHWVFSAWMGNYGNEPASSDRTRDPDFRESLLADLLGRYAPHLRDRGVLLIELTDAVTDYRLADDHPMGEASTSIYPVRHTPEQVERCARQVGLSVVRKELCVSYGHHPRTLYVLRKDRAAEAGYEPLAS